jgi:hypothetical protein
MTCVMCGMTQVICVHYCDDFTEHWLLCDVVTVIIDHEEI